MFGPVVIEAVPGENSQSLGLKLGLHLPSTVPINPWGPPSGRLRPQDPRLVGTVLATPLPTTGLAQLSREALRG